MGGEMPPAVLVIDDDPIARELISVLVRAGGSACECAGDGEHAVRLIESGRFSPGLILADVKMPGLSGLELIARLRACSGAFLCAISASEPPEELRAATDGLLRKPFTPGDLLGLVGEAARGLPPQRSAAIRPPVSPETLGQMREIMSEAGVRTVYTAVVDDLERRLAALDAAIASGDAGEVRRIGHAIKGGCGMAGAIEAARLGALLEDEGDRLDHAARLVAQLRVAGRDLRRALAVEFSG